MRPSRPCLVALLFISSLVHAQAAADVYLRQGPPRTLRVARALIPPPPVNELILALGKPVEAAPATNESPAEPVFGQPPEGWQTLLAQLRSALDVLLPMAGPANPVVVDTTPAPEPEPDPLEIITSQSPVVAPPAGAGQLGELLMLFNNRRDAGHRNAAVIVAPPIFQPPQTTVGPPSRAVYRTQ